MDYLLSYGFLCVKVVKKFSILCQIFFEKDDQNCYYHDAINNAPTET